MRQQAQTTAAEVTRAIARSLIVGGLIGVTTSAVGMLVVGWVRRRL